MNNTRLLVKFVSDFNHITGEEIFSEGTIEDFQGNDVIILSNNKLHRMHINHVTVLRRVSV